MSDTNSDADPPGASFEEQLLGELRVVMQRVDPPPAAYLDFARLALAVTRIDTEVGRLVYDSYTTVDTVARGATSPGFAATIEFPSLTLDLEIVDGEVIGRIDPAAAFEARLETGLGELRGQIDSDGWFSFDAPRHGPFRVVLVPVPAPGGGKPIATEWLLA